MLKEQLLIDLITALIIGGLQWSINYAFKCLSVYFLRQAPALNRLRLFLMLSVWLLSNVAYHIYWKPSLPIFLIITSLMIFLYIWKEVTQFWDRGVLRLDPSINKGLDFEGALKLCKNQLDFLGIGAWKLTSNKEFEDAIRRCNRPDIPIRFLLTKPDNPLLTDAAKRSGADSAEYGRRVEASLRILAGLKMHKKMNIQVRFYPCENNRDFPLFRLLFINNSVCLFSYHVFGEGDGTQAPQLHLKRFEDRRDTDSFYYPFSVYFNHLWTDSTAWDFEFPIK